MGAGRRFTEERRGVFLGGQNGVDRGQRGEIERCAQEKQTMCRDVGESSVIWTSHLTNTPRAGGRKNIHSSKSGFCNNC